MKIGIVEQFSPDSSYFHDTMQSIFVCKMIMTLYSENRYCRTILSRDLQSSMTLCLKSFLFAKRNESILKLKDFCVILKHWTWVNLRSSHRLCEPNNVQAVTHLNWQKHKNCSQVLQQVVTRPNQISSIDFFNCF